MKGPIVSQEELNEALSLTEDSASDLELTEENFQDATLADEGDGVQTLTASLSGDKAVSLSKELLESMDFASDSVEVDTFSPVSYTHLDVYKRQGQDRRARFWMASGKYRHRHKFCGRVPVQNRYSSRISADNAPVPVSYTHLAVIYYCGSTPAPDGMPIGACGPTTSGRMDVFTPRLHDLGLCATIGKGARSPEVCEACLLYTSFSETMQDWRVHTGTDFKGETGQDIKAIADGTISSIDSDPLWGAIIVVDHGNDMQSRYCGASPSGIEEGMAVKAGQVIGVVSDIPCETVTGAHLHLEILVKGQLVDPVKTIGREVKYTETPSGEE